MFDLSSKDRQLLMILAKGLPIKLAARQLEKSPEWIARQLKLLRAEWRAHNTIHLILLCTKAGQIDLSEIKPLKV